MQNNSLDGELQRTLNELCTDLFATSALDDCNAILLSLALLAEAFPQAQSLIGRLLSQPGHNQDQPREAFDPWETPDARVEKLQLDHRIWASGYPDAAFYQDTDARWRKNRKKQQQLTRKLLQKKKNQKRKLE
ncbi:hypothetical protein JG688_00013437 [Phytophthora aleatoria]|uniref:Uncharacterized protein n=1 Tax=Phytophthora aleatoria TaxID=2496075 RepID=A0A8J5IM53_9STRA|nr:hypothetical protein JG688_00013437 [Phytophthora aleatoria]